MLFDSSVLIELVKGPASDLADELVGSYGGESVYISTLQIAEIADWSLRAGHDPSGVVSRILVFAREVHVDGRICVEGASIKHTMRKEGMKDFGLIDGIVLASARSVGQRLLTLDPDFTKAGDAVVLGPRSR